VLSLHGVSPSVCSNILTKKYLNREVVPVKVKQKSAKNLRVSNAANTVL